MVALGRCDQRAIKESIAAALTDLNQLAELSVMPGSGIDPMNTYQVRFKPVPNGFNFQVELEAATRKGIKNHLMRQLNGSVHWTPENTIIQIIS